MPIELIEAQAAGELVLFVGAGASLNRPSNLPLFAGLAKQIGRLALRPYRKGMQIDRFLGELSGDFDVHGEVRRLIDRPRSAPNENHRAIVNLAASRGMPKIVTTNFDLHLSRAADELGLGLGDTFHGPALPVGRDFSGLVHLHGSIARPEADLVLTDHDFGRAYLTDAWATRFLREMFQHYVVLFVGFSHDDPIVNYLGMGLPSGTRRYILTSNGSEPRLKRLKIHPVEYPWSRGHDAMTLVLSEWARQASMNSLEHQARIRDIVRGGPPKNPVEADYLRRHLESPTGAKAFADSAAAPDWLTWLEDHDVFIANFRSEPQLQADTSTPEKLAAWSEASRILGLWFADKFVRVADHHGAGFTLLMRQSQVMSDQLFRYVLGAISVTSSTDLSSSRRWAALMSSSIRGQTAPSSIESLFVRGGLSEPSFALFWQALRPKLKLSPNWLAQREVDDEGETDEDPGRVDYYPSVELEWQISEDLAKGYWNALLSHVPDALPRAMPLFESALLSAFDLLEAWNGPTDSNFDALSYRRTAIEDHEQDRFREVIDLIIDGLRDGAAAAGSSDSGLVERWWNYKYTLFRRLALYVLSTTGGPDARLDWLLDRGLLYDSPTKHEVYGLLASSIALASGRVRDRLLVATREGPPPSERAFLDEENLDYMRFNLLSWLVEKDPSWDGAQHALAEIQARRPHFEPREGHMDVNSWTESGVWVDEPPESLETFVARVDENADRAVQWLLAAEYSDNNFKGRSWVGALSMLRSLSQINPAAGLEVWKAISRVDDVRVPSVKIALLNGWSGADLGSRTLQIAGLVGPLAQDPDAAYALSSFLYEQMRARSATVEALVAEEYRDIADNVWALNKESFTHREDFDPSSLMLNSWPGRIAQFWVFEVSRRWTADGDGWHGLNAEESEALLGLLNGPAQTTDATHAALASEVLFMHGADADFAVQHLFPLFAVEGRERVAWEPYLYHSRWNNRFLRQGFLNLLVGALPISDAVDHKGLRNEYWMLFSSIVVYADLSVDERVRLVDSLVIEAGGSRMILFLDALSRLMADFDATQSDEIWHDWLGGYMLRRFEGHPRLAKVEELETWADSVLELRGNAFVDGVSIVLTKSVGFRARSRIHDLDAGIVGEHSHHLVDYFIHRLESSNEINEFASYQIGEAVVQLVEHLGRDNASRLVAAAAVHGIQV